MVNRTSPLNVRQLEVLKWISDGCPDDVMMDFTYKTTAVALHGRRLVTVSRKGGGWPAALTDVGAHYLEHDTLPADAANPAQVADRPARPFSEATSRSADPPRPAGQSVPTARPAALDAQAQALVARVVRAGGALELDLEDDETEYKRLLTAAKRAPNLPFGRQLRMRAIGPYWNDEHETYLDEDFAPRIPSRAVPVPERVASYHPAVRAYRSDPDRHEVSKGSLDRACRLLQALAAEAERRGYTARAVGQRQLNQYQRPSAPRSRTVRWRSSLMTSSTVYASGSGPERVASHSGIRPRSQTAAVAGGQGDHFRADR